MKQRIQDLISSMLHNRVESIHCYNGIWHYGVVNGIRHDESLDKGIIVSFYPDLSYYESEDRFPPRTNTLGLAECSIYIEENW